MRPFARNALALLVGLLLGGSVNMALVTLGPVLIAPPPGVDMTTAEGLQAAIPLLEPKHYLMPFLAHALGTLVGAWAGVWLAISHRSLVAYAIGIAFLCGGIAASAMIPAPSWFKAVDLVGAYIPMAWLGLTLATRMKRDDAEQVRSGRSAQ